MKKLIGFLLLSFSAYSLAGAHPHLLPLQELWSIQLENGVNTVNSIWKEGADTKFLCYTSDGKLSIISNGRIEWELPRHPNYFSLAKRIDGIDGSAIVGARGFDGYDNQEYEIVDYYMYKYSGQNFGNIDSSHFSTDWYSEAGTSRFRPTAIDAIDTKDPTEETEGLFVVYERTFWMPGMEIEAIGRHVQRYRYQEQDYPTRDGFGGEDMYPLRKPDGTLESMLILSEGVLHCLNSRLETLRQDVPDVSMIYPLEEYGYDSTIAVIDDRDVLILYSIPDFTEISQTGLNIDCSAIAFCGSPENHNGHDFLVIFSGDGHAGVYDLQEGTWSGSIYLVPSNIRWAKFDSFDGDEEYELAVICDDALYVFDYDPLEVSIDPGFSLLNYSLSAFPNPFNSSTTINYSLPRPGRYAIDVIDIQGRLVTRLSDGWKEAGSYREVWKADVATSGIFIIRLGSAYFEKHRLVYLVK